MTACASGPPRLHHHLSGAETTVEQLRGHVVVLNFWAEWCGPCVAEIPFLHQAVTPYGEDAIFVAAYANDEFHHRSQVNLWLKDQPAFFAQHVVWADGEIHHRFEHNALPTTYLLDRQGAIVRVFVGAIVGEKREQTFRDALEQAVAAPH
jgi:thiol-disulfide isomerase/thioredoxin